MRLIFKELINQLFAGAVSMGYRYLGSKSRVVDEIMQIIGGPNSSSGWFIDAFCGTGSVSSCAADYGWKVCANDNLNHATVMTESRLLSYQDISFERYGGYEGIIDYLNSIEGVVGYNS